MKKIFLLLCLFPSLIFSQDYILVKQIWGEVNVVQENTSKSNLMPFSTLNFNESIELINKNSKVWFRDNKNNHIIIPSKDSETKKRYTYNDIASLLARNNKISQKLSFVEQALLLISMPKTNNTLEINGMQLSAKTGVSRSLFANGVIAEDILVCEGLSFKIDFSTLLLNDTTSKSYSILIRDKFSKKTLFDFECLETYFEIDGVSVVADLSLNWQLEIFLADEEIVIAADIKSKQLDKKSKNLLFSLKEKAFLEINAEEPFYPLIFVETLHSLGLTVNAKYYADFFNLD